jgi:hypothetical protein
MERTLDSAAHLQRVCRAWHSASEVQGLAPGVRGAEGEEQGQGVTARRGLTAAHAKEAGRRTGTGYEVWHTRDERARDREVLHPQGVCVINPASRRGTFCVVPREICRPSPYAGLRAEGSVLTDRQTSAEGIVGPPQARLVRHPTAERRGNG